MQESLNSIIGKMWKKKKIGQKGRRKIEKQFLELAKALASKKENYLLKRKNTLSVRQKK